MKKTFLLTITIVLSVLLQVNSQCYKTVKDKIQNDGTEIWVYVKIDTYCNYKKINIRVCFEKKDGSWYGLLNSFSEAGKEYSFFRNLANYTGKYMVNVYDATDEQQTYDSYCPGENFGIAPPKKPNQTSSSVPPDETIRPKDTEREQTDYQSNETEQSQNQSETNSYQSEPESNNYPGTSGNVNTNYQQPVSDENARIIAHNNELLRLQQQSKENYENQLKQSGQIEEALVSANNYMDILLYGMNNSGERLHEEKVESIASFDYEIESPEQLIREFENRREMINDEMIRRREERKKEDEAYYNAVTEERNKIASSEMDKASNEIANLVANYASGISNQKRMEEENKKWQEELESNLKEEMTNIKDEYVQRNEQAIYEFNRAYLQAVFDADEEYYRDMIEYLTCQNKYMEDNFDYESTSWLSTDCRQPKEITGHSNNYTASDFLEAAKRKYDLYLDTYDTEFYEYSKKYVNNSLAIDPEYVDAYVFRAEYLDETFIDRVIDYSSAYRISMDYSMIEAIESIKPNLTKEIFIAVDEEDQEYLEKATRFYMQVGILNEAGESPLIYALKNDKAIAFEYLLDGEPSKAAYIDNNSEALVMLASASNSIACLKLLDKRGLSLLPNAEQPSFNPLYVAIEESSVDVIDFLVAAYSDKELTEILDLFKMTYDHNKLSLLCAAILYYNLKSATDWTERIIKYDPNIYSYSYHNSNLIACAIKDRNANAVTTFLKNGASPDMLENNNVGYPLLVVAIELNQPEMVTELLQNGASHDVRGPDGLGPVSLAIRNGYVEVLKILLDHGVLPNELDNNGNSSLYQAFLAKDKKMIKLLLEAKSDINTMNSKKWSPLILCVYQNELELCSDLIIAGADINAQGEYGWTPLHYAVRENNEQMVKLLLQYNASTEIKDEWGRTPRKIAKERHFNSIKNLF